MACLQGENLGTTLGLGGGGGGGMAGCNVVGNQHLPSRK